MAGDFQVDEQITTPLGTVPVQAPGYAGTWSNYGTPYRNGGYWKQAGIVHLTGVVKSTGTDNTIFTLPAGYRPSGNLFWRVSSSSAGSEDVTISSAGVVTVGTGVAHSYLCLDGVTFLAEA